MNMKVTAINGLISKMAELRRFFANYNKSWERKEKGPELLDSDSAPPQAPPQQALHSPKRGSAWFFRAAFGGRRPAANGLRPRRRSSWRTTVGDGDVTENAIGAAKSKAAGRAESENENITGMPERVISVSESDNCAIDIAIRARNQRVGFFSLISRRKEMLAQTEQYIIGKDARPAFTQPIKSGSDSL